ncbi:2-oxoglutarate (2OG) and Fe(II)-dependent oxygenase superfamily protein [Striga hermonthica]|uniref:2-oxoglutarate (2OG) and Fe(II)-dependent oxygenase superfamily protein n=1 Tax=Striga hermonthica TaxID=68872 RepID=A0A9N7ME23_STRHE|nr:2-oxoglutarate (2OG) and Fe(II)-dependent oxygenase superfamily protein [Striga hermonthica]
MGLEVDPAFIQAPEHRPELESVEADNVPLIDLSPLSSPEPDPAALRQLIAAIGGACENWGFFQVVNHGVPPDSLRRIESSARDFFALPKEEKRRVARDEVNPTGYYDTEHTKNVRDWKEVFDFTVQVPTVIPATHVAGDEGLKEMVNHWPEYPPKMRKICEEHAAEIQRKSDGKWVLVKPTPDAYIINVGDIIQVWSNDKYESVEHRVKVNSEKERLSIPFFFNPAFYTMVEPLAELLNDQSPAKYRAYNWGKFFTTRKLSNFKKLDVENIQIHQFKN